MDKWMATANEFVQFLSSHARFPRRASKDSRERRLHIWMLNQRAARVGRSTSTWSVARQEYLDSLLPGWDTDRHETWEQHAADLAAFVYENARFPRQRSENTHERQLWAWLRRQRDQQASGQAPWTAQRQEHLDRHVPGWAGQGAVTAWSGPRKRTHSTHNTVGFAVSARTPSDRG